MNLAEMCEEPSEERGTGEQSKEEQGSGGRSKESYEMLLIAVRPELQNKGINAIILDHVMKCCIKNGITHAESGPQLELNYKINSQWKGFDIEQHKRRRCFVKKLQ